MPTGRCGTCRKTILGFALLLYGALGDSYRQHGRWDEAKAWYHKALDFTDAPVIRVESSHVFGALADLELRQGHLGDAAGLWSKALAAIQDRENWGRLPAAGHRLGLSACGRASVRTQRVGGGLGPRVAWVGARRARRRCAGAHRRLCDRGSLEADRRRRQGGGRVSGTRASAAGGGTVSGLDQPLRTLPDRSLAGPGPAQVGHRVGRRDAGHGCLRGAAGERSRAIGAGRVLIARADAPAREQAGLCSPACSRPPRQRGGQVSRSRR